MTIDLETRLKRLRYRTSHTGTKETDILLGSFVEKYSDSLIKSEVEDLENLLRIGNDPLVYQWIVQGVNVPEEYNTTTLNKIRSFVIKRDLT
ncbi:MAG: succinate dehydrogenase assembly factor 2 [Rhodospirillaceae bacterium]|nr:succinate dehydrogenase assembly factor 2 [Rhodospirillaceae bacterium]|tara:strand:+ start:2700 stop:2975 length:276 start_codon:yes stop_codon:yes gene_type:complete